jgi:hypothetical protein
MSRLISLSPVINHFIKWRNVPGCVRSYAMHIVKNSSIGSITCLPNVDINFLRVSFLLKTYVKNEYGANVFDLSIVSIRSS